MPLSFKMFCYTANYRTKLNFTFEGAFAAQKALERLYDSYLKNLNGSDEITEEEIERYKEKFLNNINDDMNMPAAMGVVWEAARNQRKSPKLAELLLKFDEVLGLDIKNANKYLQELKDMQNNIEIPEEVKKLVEERKTARQEKDWEKSDTIRNKIENLGYSIKDTKDGIIVEKL